MKKELIKCFVAILSVPILIICSVIILSNRVETVTKATVEKNNSEYIEGQEDEYRVPSMREQGYVRYQMLPERMKTVVRTDLFKSSAEHAKLNANEGEELTFGEERMELVEQIDSESICDIQHRRVVGAYGHYAGGLSFDMNTYQFTDREKIQQIEACGFDGFSELLDKVAEIIKEREKKIGAKKFWEYNFDTYLISCQGAEFRVQKYGMDNFELTYEGNLSTCYVPQKYKSLVERVVEGGEYYLYQSSVGAETEVLTFVKNNSIAVESVLEVGDLSDEMTNNKRLVLLFENGKLTNYYMTNLKKELKLDDVDKKILEVCTSGLDKELPSKPTKTSEFQGQHNVYWAE